MKKGIETEGDGVKEIFDSFHKGMDVLEKGAYNFLDAVRGE
ncbi:hypothetical protein LCGC14_1858950 [marine sediment metagenome]|uniref:Uncharacterized protein n=1 Tax=marine sediment metagenome TaxID=412755 RepID=A0A0F9G8C2_9ZZZZ